jgi:ParB family chromosome partitioning protein
MGRGLAAILSSGSDRAQPGLRELAIDAIEPNPTQPRRAFDDHALIALAESVKARGILQPVVVRPLPDGRFELVAGERRLRAAKIAGHDRIPAIVRDTDEAERLELALIENMARQDLNPIEEARACATLVEDLAMTKEEVGRRVGRSRVAISNLIRLLELPDEAIEMLEAGELSEGHGRALLLAKDHSQRRQLARSARDYRWSVRETERRAREAGERRNGRRPSGSIVIHPDLEDLLAAAEDALSAALGREVQVRQRGSVYRVELELEHPREGLELAERLMRRAAAA